LSSEEQDERKEYVNVQPGTAGATSEVLIRGEPGATVVQRSESPPSVKQESIVKRKTTNTSALVGIAVGVAVLAIGLVLVLREAPVLPYPLSVLVIVVVAVALIGVGASLVSNRTTTRTGA
jgi:hypothetical protein